jgi:hypothetical protein
MMNIRTLRLGGGTVIKVRVCQRSASGALVQKGHLECRGVKVKQPDGRVRVELDHNGEPIPEEVVLRPPGVVSPQAAVRITSALAAGHLKGQVAGLEWFVVS